VVTEATFKVRPLPERQHGLVLGTGGMAAALALGADIDGALAVVAEGELGTPVLRGSVVVRLGGVEADVAASRTRLLALAVRHGATVELDADGADSAIAGRFAAGRDFPVAAPGDLVVRLATLPARLSALAAAATSALDGATGRWLADPRRG